MKNIQTLILPDVHGRSFWREPVKTVLDSTESKIVFLGDYLSPYPYEFEEGEDYNRIAIDVFKEIIELKKQYPDRIVLLLGNHDCSYAIGDDICQCRTDYKNYKEISDLFLDNQNLFQLAYEENINDTHIIYSHAGVLKEFMKLVNPDIDFSKVSPVDFWNNAWYTQDFKVLDYLGVYDRYRGWGGGKYGSIVWADIQSWLGKTIDDTYGFNIVGHSQLEKNPIRFDTIVDLDCRRAFYLNTDGNVIDFDSDEEVKKTSFPK